MFLVFDQFTAAEYIVLFLIIPIGLVGLAGVFHGLAVLPPAWTNVTLIYSWGLLVWFRHLNAIRRRFQHARALDEYLYENLYSDDFYQLRRATFVLEVLAGKRFGSARLGKRFEKTIEQWRTWWERYRDELVWDHELRVFLTPQEHGLRFQGAPR